MAKTQIAAGRTFTYLEAMGRNAQFGQGFSQPVGVARGKGDTIYVASWGSEFAPAARVTKCTLNHEFIADIGEPGSEDGQFLWPGGIALDSEENIYVTDQSVHKVVRFTNEGTFLGKWGTAGSGDGQLNFPSGVAIDKGDNVYIVDARNHRVQKFTRDGKFLAGWGGEGSGEGQFSLPWGITVDGNGNVYVVDSGNDRVQKFTSEGTYLTTFGSSGTGEGELTRPSGVAVDKDGEVYVADWGNNRVHVYTAEGDYLATFIGDALELSPWARLFVDANPDYVKARARADLEPEWRLRRPVALAVGEDYRILILENQHNRLQIYLKDVGYEDPQFNL